MKILVIRYRFFGDTILTVPFLEKLKEFYPDSEVHVLVSPQSGQVLKNCPYIDKTIDFLLEEKFHKYEKNKNSSNSFLDLIFKLRKEKFDKVFILKRSFSSALISFLAGIPERIGFDTELRGFLLTKRIKFNPKISEVLNFFACLSKEFLNEKATSKKYFWASQEEKQKALNLIQKLNEKNPNTKKIILHAKPSHPFKKWHMGKWASLIKLLKKKNYQIIFSGIASEKKYYDQIEKLSENKIDLKLFETDNNLRENMAFYELCDLAVCVDSGPMHLAAATAIKTLGLFGPTDSNRWHPWSNKAEILTAKEELSCRPCNLKISCNNLRPCLNNLEAKEVFNKIEEMLLL